MIMEIKVIWISLLLLLMMGQSEEQQFQEPIKLYRLFRELTFNLVGQSATEPRLLSRASMEKRIQEKIPSSTEFPCEFIGPGDKVYPGGRSINKKMEYALPRARSESRPTSVHALRPGDIDVIGGMGDSLTAANGAAATTIFQVTMENRGVSWSIGGQGTWRDFLTIPNILKLFNPNLIGFSLGDSYGHHRATQFNVAELGAMSSDLIYMAKQLVRRMTHDPRVNIKKDWKLVTLMIGPNDFCLDICYLDNIKNAPIKHRQELLKALKIIKKNLPRTLVNLVPAPNVEILKNYTEVPSLCQITYKVECPCFFGETFKRGRSEYSAIIKRWQQIDIEMETEPELNDSDDFAVVVQPFVLDLEVPTINGITDYSLLSTDCFHFSQKGNARAANALWNNMFQPVGQKSRNWEDPFKTVMCPTAEFPYIYTRKNSERRNGNQSPINYDLDSNLLKRSLRVSGL